MRPTRERERERERERIWCPVNTETERYIIIFSSSDEQRMEGEEWD